MHKTGSIVAIIPHCTCEVWADILIFYICTPPQPVCIQKV